MKVAQIEIHLEGDRVQILLDGKLTHETTVHSEEEFVEYLNTIMEEYSWWIGEAWRDTLDELEDDQ